MADILERVRGWRSTMTYTTGCLVAATVIGNGIGWFYNIYIARALGLEQFGIFGALVSIFYVATIGGNAFRMEVANIIARISAQYGEDAAYGYFLKLGRQLFFIVLGVLVIFLIFSPRIAAFTHAKATGEVIITGFAVFGTLIFMVVMGLVQGLQQFRKLGIIGYVMPPGVKFVTGLAMVQAGLGITGAMASLLFSEFGSLITALLPMRKRLRLAGKVTNLPGGSIYKLVLFGLLLAFFIAMPTNIDVVLVGHFLGAEAGGLYAGAAVFGKVITFLAIGMSLVMLPLVARRHVEHKPSLSLLIQTLVSTIVLTGIVTLVFSIFPDWLVRVFFGDSFRGVAPILGWYGIAMIIFSADFILVQYALAVNKRGYIVLAALTTAVIITGISLWHNSLEQVILIIIGGNALLFLACCPLLFPFKRELPINSSYREALTSLACKTRAGQVDPKEEG